MSRSSSWASSGGSSQFSRERNFGMDEHFETLPASLTEPMKGQLQHRRRLLEAPGTSTVIATSVSPGGCIATATPFEIRLYFLEKLGQVKEIRPHATFPVGMQSKNEKIRSIAISDELLAVVTHCRLIVYEYKYGERLHEVQEVRLDQSGNWTPKAVSVTQIRTKNAPQSAVAFVAVGGGGINAVRLFCYSRLNCWNALSDKITLRCPQNSSSLRLVGFSNFVRDNALMVFGVTAEERLFCWNVRAHERGPLDILSTWELECGNERGYLAKRAEVTSVSMFESPSRKPYVFCTLDQTYGSASLRTFVAPLEGLQSGRGRRLLGWRPVPERVTGRHVLMGNVSPNGRYLVTVEDGIMRLLTLRGAFEGGLTCENRGVQWSSSMEQAARDVSCISVAVLEHESHLEVIAVDGRSHVVSANISIPSMRPAPKSSLESPSIAWQIPELFNERIIPELDTENSWSRLPKDGARSKGKEPVKDGFNVPEI